MKEKQLEIELVLPEILKEYFIGHEDGPIKLHFPKLSKEIINSGVTIPIPFYPNKNDFPNYGFIKLKYIDKENNRIPKSEDEIIAPDTGEKCR